MTDLDALFAAERVKWRKSWLLVVAVLAPLCQVAFLGLLFAFSESRVRMFKPGFRFWLELNFVAWNLVVMPLAAALVSELSWEQEREARAWTRLLVQPHAWAGHFQVKLLAHGVLLLGALALLALGLLLGGLLLQRNPDLLMGALPWPLFVRFLGYSALALVPVVAFQTWLSMRVPGLVLALGAAFLGSWSCLRLADLGSWVQALPWGLSSQMAVVFERWRVLPWGQVPGALVAGSALMIWGALDFARRRETQA